MIDPNEVSVAELLARETLAEQLVPLLKQYDVKYRGHGLLYVDHQQYNIVTAHRILADLSTGLGVPIQLVRSRLEELGWFNDARCTSNLRQEVAKVTDKLEFCVADLPEEDGRRIGKHERS